MPTINELFSLAGRVAIVTGGSRGLGQEMAEGLGEAGCALMLCARRNEWLRPTVDAMRARGFRVEGMPCDVAKPPDVQAVVDKTVAVYGKVDILINNAGVTWAAEPEDLPFDKWQKVVDINLTGAFLFSQAAGRDMLTRQWGRKGIRVNAIAPGFFHSRLADAAIEMTEPAIKATSPIPRVGDAGELKGVAVFLAADASNYITGQTIVVDGGRTIA